MTTQPLKLSSKAEYLSFVDQFDTFMFDCDGVLWHDESLVPGAVQVLEHLRALKKKIIFVTNNATKSRKNYKKKFDRLGVQAEVDEVFGSAYASAVYISSVLQLPKDEKVYVIGQAGLEEELDEEGIQHIGGTVRGHPLSPPTILLNFKARIYFQDPADKTFDAFDITKFERDPKVAVVLAGLDTAINYTKLAKAMQYLTQNPGCRFIATNEDSTYPVGGGQFLPGAGSISAPLRYITKTDPVSIGKPNQAMMDTIKAKHHFDPKKTVMIGDRLDTDIIFGNKGGCSTLLVLTGVAKEADLRPEANPPVLPDFIVNSLGDLAVLKN
ncbi:hypothetical protein M407DRAFT_205017 [Tulasnella calospora MUT 4182]|uniref:4-nitrophenylphosphatase n=1 Tax=Tulasnella calospora MUT 4182 TaxID=1051891 RepID=A0A0C3QUQ3_9AGAM|nr:hypothetical protein M407DRAFT_205017 [Tulasnella calospora MUT 4182]